MVFGHMEPQMTKKMWWWYFESKYEGTVHIPCEDFTKEEIEKENEGDIEGSVGFTVGFGVRMSAPGYLDCTAWEVFDDEDDAQSTYDAFVDEIAQSKYEAGEGGEG